jgi:hypothetical protein
MGFKKLLSELKRLNHDQRGDIPVGPILIIGLIAIPMVIALIAFSDDVLGYIAERFDTFKTTDGTSDDAYTP